MGGNHSCWSATAIPQKTTSPTTFKIGSSAQSTFTMNVKLPPGRMGASCQNWIFYKLSSGQAATALSGRTPRLRSEEAAKDPNLPTLCTQPWENGVSKIKFDSDTQLNHAAQTFLLWWGRKHQNICYNQQYEEIYMTCMNAKFPQAKPPRNFFLEFKTACSHIRKAQCMLQKVWRSASSHLSSKLHPLVSLLLSVSRYMIDKRLSLGRRMTLWKQTKPQTLNQKDQKDPAMSALERPPREIPPQKFLKSIVHWHQPEKYTIKEFS